MGVVVLGSPWLMELSMANGRAVIKARAAEVPVGNDGVKSEILDAVRKLTGFNRGYTPRSLKQALGRP
jgi:hypothetical protein